MYVIWSSSWLVAFPTICRLIFYRYYFRIGRLSSVNHVTLWYTNSFYTLSFEKENFQNFISIGCSVCHRCFKLYRQSMQTSLTQSCKVHLSFPTTICLVSEAPNGLSRKTDLEFELPVPNYPRKTCFQKTRFLLVPSRPMGFRGKPTSDSNSPSLITPGKLVFKKLDFYWFSVDRWAFEENRPRIRTPRP